MSTWLIVMLSVYAYVICGLIVGRISYKIDRDDCGPRKARKVARIVFLFWPFAAFVLICWAIESGVKWTWDHRPRSASRLLGVFDRILTGEKS